MATGQYVESWQYYEAESDGWPKGVKPEERQWIRNKIHELFQKHEEWTLSQLEYWITQDREPAEGRPAWTLRDAWFAAIHRALLEMGYHQVWKREQP